MPLFGGSESFNVSKTKANLQMAKTRMALQQNKKKNVIKVQRREIAQLMKAEKYDSARIKVEQTVRDEYYIEALELLMLFCDLVASRVQLVQSCSGCPVELKEAISTLIWAAPRTDGISEFNEIRKQFALKFGKEWCEVAQMNEEMAVNQRVVDKLSIAVPEPYVCLICLQDIAKEHDIEWGDVEGALRASQLVPHATGVGGEAPGTFEWPQGAPPPGPPGPPPPGAPYAPGPPPPPGGFAPPGPPPGPGFAPPPAALPGPYVPHPGHPPAGPPSPPAGGARGGGYSSPPPPAKQAAPLPPAPSAPLPDLPVPPGHGGAAPGGVGLPPAGGVPSDAALEARLESLRKSVR